jgi:hypothetical protein
MVRAVSVAPTAAVMENTRLMALIAVLDAQKMNGRRIQFLTAWSVVHRNKKPDRKL